jgi:hypothetical protein
MPRKMTKAERIKRIAEWVIHCGEGQTLKLTDILPFPVKSGIFERMTQKQIQLRCENLELCNPRKNEADFNATWDRAVDDAVAKYRNERWWYGLWKRVYVYWGTWRWPKR